jgi:hypothetical protein
MIKFYHRLNAKYKVFFWFGSLAFFLIISLIIAAYVLQSRVPALIKNTVQEKSSGVYELTFDSMKISLLKGYVKLSNIKLIPDTNMYDKMQKGKKASHLYQVEVESIDIADLNMLDFLLRKKFKVRSISILKPQITALRMTKEVKDENKEKLIDQLPTVFQISNINKLHIEGLSYRSVGLKDYQKNSSGKLAGINIEFTDIRIGSSEDSSRFMCTENIRLYGKKIIYRTHDNLYTLRASNVELSTKEKQLEIDTFSVIPDYTEREFSLKLPFKQDRYDMIYPKIVVRNIDFNYLEKYGRLPVQVVEITDAVIRIFANKGMKEKRTIASDNFPALAFQRLSLPLTIDTIRIMRTDIYYKELNPKSQRAGTVLFSKLTGELTNVSNDSIQLKKNNWISSHFTTRFLGKPILSLSLNFNMTSKEGQFNYKGSLTGAPASFYNQLLIPIALAKAEKGFIRKVKFNVNADRYQARVMTELLYNDLKVAVLEANSGEIQKKGFLSLFVNWIAVKSDNPSKKDEKPRIATLIYKHPQEKTFFNLMWKSVYAGFKVNLGLPNI